MIGGFLLLLGVTYALLLSPSVQTVLVKYVTDRIERVTGVQVQIGGVDFRPINSLVLNDVLVRDFRNDTLLYCRDLRVKADSLSFANRMFNVREVVLDGATFNLWVQDSTNYTNIEILLDSLAKGSGAAQEVTGSKKEQEDWWFSLRKISLRNSRFTYREEIYEPIEYGVNWTDVDCRNLNVDITELNFMESPMRMTVSDLNFVEKSGLQIRDMGGKVRAGASDLLITDCHIGMERSDVDLMKLEYHWTPNQHDWKYFTTRMQQYYELGPSSVSFIDLAYFNEILRGITNTVKFSGVVSNTIEQLEGRDLYFELGEHSVFQGSFKSVGLPDVWNTVFNIKLQKAHFAPADLATVYLPWFEMNIPVPSFLYRVPFVDFSSIRFDGLLSDFIVHAQSVTPELAGEMTFIYGMCGEDVEDCADMRGDFQFEKVDFGRFAGVNQLGNGAFQGEYHGVWAGEDLSFNVKSTLPWLRVNKGYVRDIDLAMVWEDDRLDLMTSLEDKNVSGGMVGSYETSDSLQFASLKGKLKIDNLDYLGWGLKDGKESIASEFDLIYTGGGKSGFTNLLLSNVGYETENGGFEIEDVYFEDRRNGKYNVSSLSSDVVDVAVEGNYQDVNPMLFVKGFIENYLPAYSMGQRSHSLRGRKYLEQFDFSYEVNIKDANRVLRVLAPDYRIASGAKIVSGFSTENNRMNLHFQADSIGYKTVDMIKPELSMSGEPKRLFMRMDADKFVYGDDYQLCNVRNDLVMVENHLDNRLSWCNWEEKTYSGSLAACVVFQPEYLEGFPTKILLQRGVIVMDDSVWHVEPSTVFMKGKEVEIKNFSVRHGDESFTVFGKVSENPYETLTVQLENFNLGYLARVALKKNMKLFGVTTGSLTLKDYYHDCLLLSDFNVNDWGIDRDTLGSLQFHSYWDADNRNLIVGAENKIKGKVALTMDGAYNPRTDSINISMLMEKMQLERFSSYVADKVSDVKGALSGNLVLKGTTKQPDISGVIILDSVGMNVNTLNTHFNVNDTVWVMGDQLNFMDFTVYDAERHKMLVNGSYRFWEDRYDIKASFNNMRMLDTKSTRDEMFYGQVNLSGIAAVDNKNGVMNVTINARTEPKSQFNVPLTSAITEQSNNFLHFIQPGNSVAKNEQLLIQPTDINLNVNLELNDNLDVQVIFDPAVGDILKTSGNGNIKLTFDKDGSLSMFGEYGITQGDYLFTLSNLVNKRFVLTPGGTITWNGSPYDAMLDISAVYNLKTTISELLPVDVGASEGSDGEEVVSESGRKVPVECVLNLSDNLRNPSVKFDINFPSLESQSKSYIQSLFSSQDEVNKQMFSLLVLNRFYRSDNTGDYGTQAQTAGVTTVTEMMSNQLSNWLSQISNNVDIGVAYRMGDPNREVSSDEIELALSTQLLNDRVTISANGNMDVGNTRNGTDSDRKTNIAGDFDVEVKLNRQGTLKMKAYSHTNEKILYNNTEMIQGVGISYQETFDTLRELLRKYFGFLRRKK